MLKLFTPVALCGRRSFATWAHVVEGVAARGALSCVSASVPVQVVTQWSDVVVVEMEDATTPPTVSVQDGALVVDAREAVGGVLRLLLPEMFTVDVVANGDITTRGKLEGDARLVSQTGSIAAHKLRGAELHLQCPGSVTIGSVLEGTNVVVKAGSVQGKRILAHSVDVEVEKSVDVSAVYAKATAVRAGGDVTLNTSKGSVDVDCTAGDITVNGINGSAVLTATLGSIQAHFDDCPASTSSLAASGDVNVSLASPVDVDLDVQGGRVSVSTTDTGRFEEAAPVEEGRAVGRLVDLGDAAADSPSSGKITHSGRHQPVVKSALSVVTPAGASIEVLSWVARIQLKMAANKSK